VNTLILILLLSFTAQITPNHHLEKDKKAVEKVADHIIANTSHGFMSPKTDQVFASSGNIPAKVPIKLISPYTGWKYWNGVMYMGMISLEKTLNDPKYLQYVSHNFDFIYNNLDHFKHQFNSGIHNVPFSQFYEFHALDNCGAMDASLIQIYNQDHKPEYRKTINRAADYISHGQKRLQNGTLVRDHPFKMTLWGDDLYMSVPFLARMGKLTGNMKYFDDAAHQVIEFHHYLYDKKEQIYYHGWFSDEHAHSVAHWGRANGWIMMAQVELLRYLPKNYPKRDTLLSILRQQIRGIARYQSKSGLWHQLIDKRDSYLETSCSAMFVYGIAKAVNEGWVDSQYFPVALQGWKGLLTKETADGQIKDVCVGTGIGDNLNFYYTRPKRLNNPHVLGAFLLAGSEMIKHDEQVNN